MYATDINTTVLFERSARPGFTLYRELYERGVEEIGL